MAEPTPTTALPPEQAESVDPEPPAPAEAEPPAPAEVEPPASVDAAPVEVEQLAAPPAPAEPERAPAGAEQTGPLPAAQGEPAPVEPAPVAPVAPELPAPVEPAPAAGRGRAAQAVAKVAHGRERKGRRVAGPVRDTWWGAALALSMIVALVAASLAIWRPVAPRQPEPAERFYPIDDGSSSRYAHVGPAGEGSIALSAEHLTGNEVGIQIPFAALITALGYQSGGPLPSTEELVSQQRRLHIGRQSRVEVDAAGVYTHTQILVQARGDELLELYSGGSTLQPPVPMIDLGLALGATRQITGTWGSSPYVAELTYAGEGSITTAAGSFEGCRQYRRSARFPTLGDYSFDSDAWYCPGVGLAREEYTRSNQPGMYRLELAAFTAPGLAGHAPPPAPLTGESGSPRLTWDTPLAAPLEPIWAYQEQGANPAVNTAPVAAGDLVLYGSENGALVAFNQATRRVAWRFQTGGLISGPPVVSGGEVFVGSGDGRLYALDLATGMLRWSFRTRDMITGSPAIDERRVYVGSHDRHVYALDRATGVEVWRLETDAPVAATPVVVGATVLIGSTDGALYALDPATGERRWSYVTGGAITSAVAVGEGAVYVASYDGSIYALAAEPRGADGELLWSNEVYSEHPPVLAGERLFLTSLGQLFALDRATGATLWRSPAERELSSAPLIFADRALMVDENQKSLVSLAVEDGHVLGEEQLPNVANFTGPTSDGARLYLGDENGYLAALGANGALAWDPRPRWQTFVRGAQPATLDLYTSPALPYGDAIVYVSASGVVARLETADGALSILGQVEHDGAISGPSAIVGDTLYGRSGKDATTNSVFAFDLASGRTLWRSPSPAGYSAPIVVGGRVLVYGQEGPHSVAEAFDAASGASLWRRELPDRFGIGSALSDGRWLVTGGEVHALDPATGEELATSENLTFVDLAVTDETIYGFAFVDSGYQLVALDPASLAERWRAPIAYRGGIPNIQGVLAAGEGYVAILFHDGSLAVHDGAGEEIWHTPGTGEARGRPLIHGGHIFVATARFHLMAYSLADGAIRGDLASRNAGTRQDVSSMAPLIVGDRLYVTLDSTAMAVDLEAAR